MKIIEEKGIKIVILQGIETIPFQTPAYEAHLIVREPLMCPNYVYVIKNRYGNQEVMWTESTFNVEKNRIIERHGVESKKLIPWEQTNEDYFFLGQPNSYRLVKTSDGYVVIQNGIYREWVSSLAKAKLIVEKLENLETDTKKNKLEWTCNADTWFSKAKYVIRLENKSYEVYQNGLYQGYEFTIDAAKFRAHQLEFSIGIEKK